MVGTATIKNLPATNNNVFEININHRIL